MVSGSGRKPILVVAALALHLVSACGPASGTDATTGSDSSTSSDSGTTLVGPGTNTLQVVGTVLADPIGPNATDPGEYVLRATIVVTRATAPVNDALVQVIPPFSIIATLIPDGTTGTYTGSSFQYDGWVRLLVVAGDDYINEAILLGPCVACGVPTPTPATILSPPSGTMYTFGVEPVNISYTWDDVTDAATGFVEGGFEGPEEANTGSIVIPPAAFTAPGPADVGVRRAVIHDVIDGAAPGSIVRVEIEHTVDVVIQ